MRKITLVDFFGYKPDLFWNLDFIPREGEKIQVGETIREVCSVKYVLDESSNQYEIKIYTTNT